jgi:glycosyltransferase involved in cell wall biosynthesis
MRIGYDALVLHPPYSGVQVTVEQAGRALAEALGSELVRFVPRGYGEGGVRSPRPTGASVYYAPISGGNRLARVLWEQGCLPGAARRAGVDLLHGPAYVLPLRWRGKSVLTVHDLLTLTHPQWCKRGNVAHFRLVMPRAMRQATRIVTPSATVAEAVAARPGVDGSKVRVLPWGVEERFRPAAEAEQERARARYGLAGPYLLTVGNIEPKKNQAGLLQIFRRMAGEVPHQLVVVGREAWGDPRPWRRALEELPPARVKWLGYVPPEDLPALYSGTDLYLQLSWYEGFGLPPLEAMACGAAAVVSNRGALPEVSGPGAAVVDPADQAETARAVLGLLQDETARRALAERGRAHAAQFTWARHVEGLVEVYREVLGR